MIFYLDAQPTRCASFYAVDHLLPTAEEAIQVLSDATRGITDEWRTDCLEKKLSNPLVETRPAAFFDALDRNTPLPLVNLEHPLVKFVVQDQDAWDWMLEFASDMVHEVRNWHYRTAQPQVDALAWIRVHAPRPINVGRVLSRKALFPLVEMQRDFLPPEASQRHRTFEEKRQAIVHAYRLKYWSKYRHQVRYTKARCPSWWRFFTESLDSPTLASSLDEK